MIQIVDGLFTHHDAVEAFRLKFRILGSERRYEVYEWKLNLYLQTEIMIITHRKDNCGPKIGLTVCNPTGMCLSVITGWSLLAYYILQLP